MAGKRNSGGKPAGNVEVYERLTQRVLEAIEKGGADLAPWRSGLKGSKALMPPHNAFFGNTYRGVNLAMLSIIGAIEGYETNGYATFKQIQERGGRVKANERGVSLLAFYTIDKDAEGNNIKKERGETDDQYVGRIDKRILIAKPTAPVFNFDQTTGLDRYMERYRFKVKDEVGGRTAFGELQESLADLIEKRLAETVTLKLMGTPTQPRYRPLSHEIIMPNRHGYESTSRFAETLLHEGTHSTMWATGRFKDKEELAALSHRDKKVYAQEELVAELGSLFIASRSGIETEFCNKASYIDHWGLRIALKENPSLLIEASAKATAAAEYLMDDTYLAAVDRLRADAGFSMITDFSEETLANIGRTSDSDAGVNAAGDDALMPVRGAFAGQQPN